MKQNFIQQCLTFLVLIIGLTSTPILAVERIKLHLKWFHQFQFAGYYAALEKGYYQDAGLGVEILESLNGATEIYQKVLTDEGNYGVGSTDVLLAYHEGKPIVVLAVIFQHSPSVLITKRTSLMQSIHDIVGERVMIAPHSDEIRAYFKKEDIDPSDIIELEHSFNFDDLIKGKVYALNGYSTDQTYYLEKAHFPYQAYSPRTAGIDFYGDNLYTSQLELDEHPKRVKAFREASLRGWQYAMSNQEEIVDLILTKYSQRLSREHLLFEAKQMVPLLQPILVEMGYMNYGRWQHIADVYADLGMLPKNIDLEGFIYEPDPHQNLTWVYKIFAALLAITAIGWIVQWRRFNKNYAENLKKEVEIRTKELQKSNQGLYLTNNYLENALTKLTEAQNRLLLSEKLATLGQLAAGMAHELNTPLAAIVSSNQAITDFFNSEMKDIPYILSKLNQEDTDRFEMVLQESLSDTSFLDGRLERALKKELSEKYATNLKMLKSDDHIQAIIGAGAYRLGDKLSYILKSENSLAILTTASQITSIYRLNSVISIAADKASHVIKALQSYLISAHDTPEENSTVDIVHEIETILSLYHNQLKNKVKIKRSFTTDKRCIGSKDKLNQIWINLLNNGLQAMSYSGDLEIKIEAIDSWIKTTFIDSGVGIPEENREKIFEPFFTTKRQGGGMGLGLDICKKIITSMGGKIELESEPGRTSFSVWLRCEKE
jgi:signal transduction histidine kinase